MADRPCTYSELIARVVALEGKLEVLRQVLDERDERYKLRAATQDNAVNAALETSDKALVKAESAIEKRFDSVNEFRQTLADQANTLMPRAEYTVQHRALIDKVDLNENRINQLHNEISGMMARGTGTKDTWGYVGVIVGLVIAVAAIYFHH